MTTDAQQRPTPATHEEVTHAEREAIGRDWLIRKRLRLPDGPLPMLADVDETCKRCGEPLEFTDEGRAFCECQYKDR